MSVLTFRVVVESPILVTPDVRVAVQLAARLAGALAEDARVSVRSYDETGVLVEELPLTIARHAAAPSRPALVPDITARPVRARKS